MESKHFRRRAHGSAGISMPEIIVTIAIIGILSAIAATVYSGVNDRAEDQVAASLVEDLNMALSDYEQLNWRIKLDAIDTSTTDEMLVVRSLQYRNPVNPAPGSPYMRPDWHPVESSDSTRHRIIWQGRHFALLTPGTAGKGLLVNFEAGDMGDDYQFPTDYVPLGLADDSGDP